MAGRFYSLSLPRSLHAARTWIRLSLAVACAAAVGLIVAAQDASRRCTEDVWTAVRNVDESLPHNPELIEAAFERLSYAADLCSRGKQDQARRALDSLRQDIGL